MDCIGHGSQRLSDFHFFVVGFPGGSEVKASASNVGDPGSIPGSGRPPGEGKGNPLQYSCLVGYSSRSRKESNMTERLHLATHLKYVFMIHECGL